MASILPIWMEFFLLPTSFQPIPVARWRSTTGRWYGVVIFAALGSDGLSVISMRRASVKEGN
jgi:hypothetical protein